MNILDTQYSRDLTQLRVENDTQPNYSSMTDGFANGFTTPQLAYETLYSFIRRVIVNLYATDEKQPSNPEEERSSLLISGRDYSGGLRTLLTEHLSFDHAPVKSHHRSIYVRFNRQTICRLRLSFVTAFFFVVSNNWHAQTHTQNNL